VLKRYQMIKLIRNQAGAPCGHAAGRVAYHVLLVISSAVDLPVLARGVGVEKSHKKSSQKWDEADVHGIPVMQRITRSSGEDGRHEQERPAGNTLIGIYRILTDL